jgi:hypothetical protein
MRLPELFYDCPTAELGGGERVESNATTGHSRRFLLRSNRTKDC